ncbi:tetratricopeptide repeat protein [Thermodesulfobacteriota bacterium]
MWHSKLQGKYGGILGATLILLISAILFVGCATDRGPRWSKNKKESLDIGSTSRLQFAEAELLYKKHRYEECEEMLTRSIRCWKKSKELCLKAPDCSWVDGKSFTERYGKRMWARYHIGKYELAIQDAKEVLYVDKNNVIAHFGLGLFSIKLGDLATARREAKVLKSLDKRYAEGLEREIGEVEAGEAVKAALDEILLGKPSEKPNRKLEEKLTDPKKATEKGIEAYNKGNFDAAIINFSYAIDSKKLSPKELSRAHWLRGNAYSRKKQYEEAFADFSKAVELNPKHPDNNNSLAWMLCTCPSGKYRDGKRAVVLAKKAVELSGWADPNLIDTLAGAYAEVGRFRKAIETQERAIAIIKKKGTSDIEEYVKHLESYKNHKPWRE